MHPEISRASDWPPASCAVSIVVATYNTGDVLHELVRSLDHQSMPQEQFEVIVVDDGSTDGTGQVLDEVAATRPNWTVRHIPNSGWPGRPRNVGLDLARGEYVAFVDHDDYLGGRALETVYAFAQEHASDVVVAREVGVGRSIGRFMFARTIPDATFENSPIVRLLTPHKVFRREMLRENGIRFLEGKVRLEDHLFTMSAYFAARRISVFADSPFYYWTLREGVAHASIGLKEPHEYVEVAVNRVLAVVDANVEPGPRRDRIKAHWLERKLLPIVARAPMLEYPSLYREEMAGAIRALMVEHYPASADVHLTFSARVRAHFLRGGRIESLLALARVEQDITTPVVAERLTWRDGAAQVQVRIELRYRDGAAVEFRREHGRLKWEPREHLDTRGLDLDVTEEVDRAVGLLVVQRRDGTDDFVVDVVGAVECVELEDAGRVRLDFVGVAQVPVGRVLDLRDGRRGFVLDLRVEFEVLGWRAVRRVAADPGLDLPLPWPADPEVLLAYRTQQHNLSLQVLAAATPPARQLPARTSASVSAGPSRARRSARRWLRRLKSSARSLRRP